MDGFHEFQTGLPSLDDVQARIDSQQEVLSSVVGDVFAPLDSAMQYQQGIMDRLNGRIKRQVNGRLNAQHEMMQGAIGGITNAVDTRIGSQQHAIATIEGAIAASGTPATLYSQTPMPSTGPVPFKPPVNQPPDVTPTITYYLPPLPPHQPPPPPPIIPPDIPPYLPPLPPKPPPSGPSWQLFTNCQTRDTTAFVIDPKTGTSSDAINSGYSGPAGPTFLSLAEALSWLATPANRYSVERPLCIPNIRPGPVPRRGMGPQSYLPPPSQGSAGLAPPINVNGPFGVFGSCQSSTLQVVNLSDAVAVKNMLASGWTNTGGVYPSAIVAQSAAAKMTPSWFDANCGKADTGGSGGGIATLGGGPPTDGGGLVWMIACNPALGLLNVFDVTSQPGLLTGGDTAGWRVALPNQFATWQEGNDYLNQPGVAQAAWAGCGGSYTDGTGITNGTPPPPDGCPTIPPGCCPPIPPCPTVPPCPPCPPCPSTDGPPPPCPCPDYDDLLHKLCKCLQSMSLSAPVDLDQPLAFIFGEQGMAWRDAAIQWHGEGLQAIVDSPSVASLVASRPEGRSMKYNG